MKPHPFARLILAAGLLCAAASADAALIHHWDLNEPDGHPAPQVLDSVSSVDGNFRNGMSDADRSTDTPIPPGRSLNFVGGPQFGNNEWVELESQITLANTATFSVALWYKGTDTGINGSLGKVLVGRDHNDVWANLVIHNGKASYAHHTSSWQQLTSTTSINDDEWHHVAFVHYADQTADIYVDGVREVTAGDATVSHASFPLRLDGFMRGWQSVYTTGLLDDVRVYNHTLTEEEVDVLLVVPEPASLALLAGGVLMLTRRRSR